VSQLHTLQMLRPRINELRDMKVNGNASRCLQGVDQAQPRKIRRSLQQRSSQQKVCMRSDHSCRHLIKLNLGRQQNTAE
jgi:hypothetical protein